MVSFLSRPYVESLPTKHSHLDIYRVIYGPGSSLALSSRTISKVEK